MRKLASSFPSAVAQYEYTGRTKEVAILLSMVERLISQDRQGDKDHERRIESVLADFKPESGVEFVYHDGMQDIFLGIRNIPRPDISDEEVYHRTVKKFGLADQQHQFSRSDIILEGRDFIEREHIGGLGVTDRTLAQIDDLLPGIGERVLKEEGKILFFGNGLSTAPVEVADAALAEGRRPDITIVDILDYDTLLRDLRALQGRLHEDGVESESAERYLGNCRLLLEARDQGKLRMVSYLLGTQRTPEEILNARLAINAIGPPSTTFAEQCRCLAHGGQLFVTDTDLKPEIGFTIKPIGKSHSSIVSRI